MGGGYLPQCFDIHFLAQRNAGAKDIMCHLVDARVVSIKSWSTSGGSIEAGPYSFTFFLYVRGKFEQLTFQECVHCRGTTVTTQTCCQSLLSLLSMPRLSQIHQGLVCIIHPLCWQWCYEVVLQFVDCVAVRRPSSFPAHHLGATHGQAGHYLVFLIFAG